MKKKTLEQVIEELKALESEALLGCVMMPLDDFIALQKKIKRKMKRIDKLAEEA